MKITLEWLKSAGACREALIKFKQVFGDEAETGVELDVVKSRISELRVQGLVMNWDYLLKRALRNKPL
ncbi:MAG: hypothetical protein MUO24_02440 [Desulfobacterales bacterium]|nr:hypothetical protein [Desulfobacterales bacterium]